MSTYVTATGLTIKTIEIILSELSTQQKATLDANMNTGAEEPLGEMNGIIAAQLRELWELGQVAYNGFNVDAVEGFLQDKLNALTGSIRDSATKGTVSCNCDLNAGTTLLAGTNYANVTGEPDNRWTPVVDYTAGVGGVQAVPFQAEFTGEEIANAATITTIATAVVGWNSVTNPLDAVEGEEVETNADYRIRREEELRSTGSATLDAVRADVLFDDNVLQCTVFENTTDVTDPVTGLPRKAIEVVVYDGNPTTLTDNEIAQLIFDTKATGMGTYGTSSGVATDSLNDSHTVYFTRPTEVLIYLRVYPKIDTVTGYAGSAALKAALVLLNDTDLVQGRDVIVARINEVTMDLDGVFDLTSDSLAGVVDPPPAGNHVVGNREIARLDTSRILVTETFAPLP